MCTIVIGEHRFNLDIFNTCYHLDLVVKESDGYQAQHSKMKDIYRSTSVMDNPVQSQLHVPRSKRMIFRYTTNHVEVMVPTNVGEALMGRPARLREWVRGVVSQDLVEVMTESGPRMAALTEQHLI